MIVGVRVWVSVGVSVGVGTSECGYVLVSVRVCARVYV